MTAELQYFRESYEDARSLFLEELKKLKPKHHYDLDHVPVTSKQAQNLFLDCAYFPATHQSKNLMILSSGVHGPEAYLGSAVQTAFLKELLPQSSREETSYLILHILNPFGCKFFVRPTENNVNLNRNFLHSNEDFQLNNAAYNQFKSWLQPENLARYSHTHAYGLLGRVGLALLRGKISKQDLISAVGLGQFHEPQGLEYGGKAREPQIQVIQEKLLQLIPKYQNIVLFDIHTGLGKKRTLHIIPGSHPKTLDPDLHQRLMPKPHRDLYEMTLTSADGFYDTHGDFNNFVADMTGPNQKLLALTLEFGTRGDSAFAQMNGLSSLIFENQGRHYGYENNAHAIKAQKEMRKSFYPDCLQWRKQAMNKAQTIIRHVLQKLDHPKAG